VHAPDAQPIAVAFITVEPQLTAVAQLAPQVAGALRLVSQPLRSKTSLSQLANPALQPVYEHAPADEQAAPSERALSQSSAEQQPPDGTQPTPGQYFPPALQLHVFALQVAPLLQSLLLLQQPAPPFDT